MSTVTTGQPAPGAQPTYTKSDFVSGQEVRWCPGCGDYSILGSMQQALAKFNLPKEKYVFISGIGCSSRFPYYMNTYGFHSIHGRAPAIASGLRCVNPDLSIWLITGDGDGLSIGGNHLIHAMRRNLNMKICLVNNQIYGLTKGQYSPTSQMGKVTKSSPYGSIDYPINALCLAIASEATFIARTLDSDPRHMISVFERAMKHKGISFIEIYQNCIIFNDKTFAPVTGRETKEDRMVYLEHGKPLVFGKLKNKAISVKGLNPEVVEFDPANPPAELKGQGKRSDDTHFLIHNENDPKPNYPYLLTQLTYPDFPVPFGIFRSIEKPTYDEMLDHQVQETIERKGKGDLKELIYGRDTWTVK